MTILAISAWVEDAEAVIRLICEDTLRTISVLRDNGYDAQEREVVLVEAEYGSGDPPRRYENACQQEHRYPSLVRECG